MILLPSGGTRVAVLAVLALSSLAGCRPRSGAGSGSNDSKGRPPGVPSVPRCRAAAPARAVAGTRRHDWGTVSYPPFSAPWGQDGKAYAVLGIGPKGDDGLRFDLTFSGGAGVPTPREGDVRVELHDARGPVPPRCAETTEVGDHRATSVSSMFFFPWQANDLREAWVEVRFAESAYRLPIPYGFTRDPGDPLPPPLDLEAPAAPPEGAVVVPWADALYELGTTGPGWSASIKQSNAAEASCELTLYKDDDSRGIESWSVSSPRTSVRVELPGGSIVTGTRAGVVREEGGHRRFDRFEIPPVTAPPGRFWATLVVGVDEQEIPVVMPSSLFKRGHGSMAR